MSLFQEETPQGCTEEFCNSVRAYGNMSRQLSEAVAVMKTLLPGSCDTAQKFEMYRPFILNLMLDTYKDSPQHKEIYVEMKRLNNLKQQKGPVFQPLTKEEQTFYSKHRDNLNRRFRRLKTMLFDRAESEDLILPVTIGVTAHVSTAAMAIAEASVLQEEKEDVVEEEKIDDDEEGEGEEELLEEGEMETSSSSASEFDDVSPPYWKKQRKITPVYCKTTSNHFNAVRSDTCKLTFIHEEYIPDTAKVIKPYKTNPWFLQVVGLDEEGEENGKIVYIDLR